MVNVTIMSQLMTMVTTHFTPNNEKPTQSTYLSVEPLNLVLVDMVEPKHFQLNNQEEISCSLIILYEC